MYLDTEVFVDCQFRNEANAAAFLASPIRQGERTEVGGFGASMRNCLRENPHPPPLPARARRPIYGSLFHVLDTRTDSCQPLPLDIANQINSLRYERGGLKKSSRA
jgi:hypothetical protein